MNTDEAARKIFNFRAQKYDGKYEAGRFKVAYHEGRLYSVRDTQRNTVTLALERSPIAAYCKAVSLPIAPPKWVPIGERKPTESREYIVLHENVAVDVLQFDAGADEFGAWEPVYSVVMGGWEGADFHRAEGVTHWLDFEIPVLPEVPEEIPF